MNCTFMIFTQECALQFKGLLKNFEMLLRAVLSKVLLHFGVGLGGVR